MTTIQDSPTLAAAYRKARTARRYNRTGDSARLPYDTRFQGPLPAADAIALARGNLAALGTARRGYRAAVARRERLDESASLGAAIGAEALQAATLAERDALNALTRARGIAGAYGVGGDYGAGTWQGGGVDCPPHAAKTLAGPRLPTYRPASIMATAMHNATESGGLWYFHGDSDALRDVRDCHDCDGGPDHTGWYDNPHGESFKDGTGLCIGIVARLRGRNGMARLVAGYRFGGHDDSGTFDLTTVYESPVDSSWDSPDCERDAARAADSMAEAAAEREKEYKSAWGAGQAWAERGERLAEIRQDLRAILAERREAMARGIAGLAALCDAIRARVDSLLAERAELMAERAELAEGDDSTFYFYAGESRLQDAFCESAGLDGFPS